MAEPDEQCAHPGLGGAITGCRDILINKLEVSRGGSLRSSERRRGHAEQVRGEPRNFNSMSVPGLSEEARKASTT